MGKTNNKLGLAFLVGAIAGGVATLFISPENKKKARKQIKQKTKDLQKMLKDVAENDRVKEIYGKVSKETTAKYRDAKQLLVTKLSLVKGSLADIDKQKYTSVLNEVMQDVKSQSSATATQLKKLKAYLEEDFSKIKAENTTKKG